MANHVSQISTQKRGRRCAAAGNIIPCSPEMQMTNLNRMMELACVHQIRKELDKFVEDLSSCSIATCSLGDFLPVLRRRMSKLLKSYARITRLYSRTPEGSSPFRIPCRVRDAVVWKPSEVEMDRGKSLLEEQVVCPEVEMDRGKSLSEEPVICPEGTHEVEEETTLELQLKDFNISGFKLDKENWESSFLLDEDDTDGGCDEEEEEMDGENSPMEEQVPSIGSKLEFEMGAEAVLGPAHLNMSDKSIVEPVSSRLEVHDDEMDRGKSDEQLSMEKEEMAAEEEDFTCYRSDWESSWGSNGCGFFEDMTQVSSMHFTHLTPRRNCLDNGIMEATLQIFSIKLVEIKGGFKWPLSVYGVVAARDAVDHNRNLLFCRNRRSQQIKQDDPFLRLIGPSRAIVFTDPVDFEIQLKVQFGALSQDRALISGTYHYAGRGPGVNMICFENCFCKIELCLERVVGSVQATVCSVRVLKQGSHLFKYGCRVACSTTSCSCKLIDGKATYSTNAPSGEVVLLNSHCPAMSKGSDGYVDLDRRVVSVQLDGSLDVVIQAYSASGDIAAQGHVSFTPKSCSVSQDKFYVDDAQVEISVAWSLLVDNRRDIVGQGWVFETSYLEH